MLPRRMPTQVVTWGHPCCFERARRKAGSPEENRAWFAVTIDLCREEWLILHKVSFPTGLVLLRFELLCSAAQKRRRGTSCPSGRSSTWRRCGTWGSACGSARQCGR